MNDFEADIYEALSAHGIKLIPQVGCSSLRIDFGACHPTEPGRFVLAIEADGATYHSSYTARDRDRLRQQMLETWGGAFTESGRRVGSTAGTKRSHALSRPMSGPSLRLTIEGRPRRPHQLLRRLCRSSRSKS